MTATANGAMPAPMLRDAARRFNARPGRFAAALVLVAALLFRGLIPAGWMPNTQAALASPLVICTANGARAIALDAQGHPAKPQTGGHRDVCAFAGNWSAPAPAAPAAAPAVAFASFAVFRPPEASVAVAAARHREQAARAPPTAI